MIYTCLYTQASAIFAHDERQKEIAAKVIADVQSKMDQGAIKYIGKKIVTTIRDAEPFYEAMAEHQEYLENNPGFCLLFSIIVVTS